MRSEPHYRMLLDLAATVILAVIVFGAACILDPAGLLSGLSAAIGTPQTAALLATGIFLIIAFLVFAVRRWIDLDRMTDRAAAADAALTKEHARLMFVNNITRYDLLNELTQLHKDLEHAEKNPVSDRVEESIGRIRRQIKFTKEYQDIGAVPPTWQNLADAIMRAKVGIDLGNVSFEMDVHDVEVYADPLLEKVFYYLITNSLKHGGSRLTKIRFARKKADDHMTIVCEDDGPGIAQEMKPFLFPKEWGSRRHSGYGLFLIREILATTGITIFESGRPGEGAKFEISVPKNAFRQV